jgi:hypothetical protein
MPPSKSRERKRRSALCSFSRRGPNPINARRGRVLGGSLPRQRPRRWRRFGARALSLESAWRGRALPGRPRGSRPFRARADPGAAPRASRFRRGPEGAQALEPPPRGLRPPRSRAAPRLTGGGRGGARLRSRATHAKEASRRQGAGSTARAARRARAALPPSLRPQGLLELDPQSQGSFMIDVFAA